MPVGHRPPRLALLLAGAGALLCAPAPRALADRIHLVSGGVLEGTATREGDSYRIRLVRGAEVVIPAADVARIEPSESPRAIHDARLAALEPTDTDGHYRLGLWCAEAGLHAEALARFRHVVSVAPDHEAARAGLGEVYWEGSWVPVAVAMSGQGLVERDGHWLTPEESARLDRAAAVREARARLRAAVRKLRLDGIDPTAREGAFAVIAGEADPHALEPLLEHARHTHADVRRAAATALARYPGDPRVDAVLARLACEDGDLAVQDAAADAIRAGRMRGACAALLERYAESPLYYVRNAAAHALGRIRYKPAAEALVATLAMRIYRRQVLPSRIDPVVRRNRNGVEVRGVVTRAYPLGAGEYRVVADVAFNDAARVALRHLAGVDHDFDTGAWIAWWRESWHRYDDFMEPIGPPSPGPSGPPPAPAGGR